MTDKRDDNEVFARRLLAARKRTLHHLVRRWSGRRCDWPSGRGKRPHEGAAADRRRRSIR